MTPRGTVTDPAKGSNVEPLLVGEAYCDDDWPHGLSCGQCRHLFREPERYIAQPDAFIDDILLTKIVCLACYGLGEGR